MDDEPLFLGIDLGTSGARAVAAGVDGSVAGSEEQALSATLSAPAGWAEQDPDAWWDAIRAVVRSLGAALGRRRDAIESVAITSTSGTLVPVDGRGRPVAPAMMYNDMRAAGLPPVDLPGGPLNPSQALARLAWCVREQPPWLGEVRRFVHAADWVVGRFTGRFDRTDPSNALKSGYDPVAGRWNEERLAALGVPRRWLPAVDPAGARVGAVSPDAADDLGLPRGIRVVNGCTDGVAAFLASGATGSGDWNSCLGSTLVVKGRADAAVADPQARFYSHAHPDGGFLPGGASNCGGECLPAVFGDGYATLETEIGPADLPTGLLVYPLVREGERLPYMSARARGFVCGTPAHRGALYAAYLEGVAGVERWIYDEARALGVRVNPVVFATGGGTSSPLWMRIRASMLARQLAVPSSPESAFGACILAARNRFPSVGDAAAAMVRVGRCYDPVPAWTDAYADYTVRLRDECRRRGETC